MNLATTFNGTTTISKLHTVDEALAIMDAMIGDDDADDVTVVEDFNDECPKHGGEIKEEYDFGMNDASVVVFYGCKCALVQTETSWMNGGRLFDSYSEAAGAARLQVQMNAAR